MSEHYRPGVESILADNRPSGNAWRDQWLAERSENELRRLDALAASEGLKLQPATVLRPLLLVQRVTNLVGGGTGAIDFYFPFYAFVRKVTTTIRHLRFVQNQEPDDATIGQLDTRQYLDGQLTRPNGDLIFSGPTSWDQWSGDGKFQYIFDLIPFVTRGDNLSINYTVSPRVATIDEVQVTFHVMRFPIEGA